MRGRRLVPFVFAVFACNKAPAPGETVATSRLPPFVPCYEADGAPCPLDAGDDGDGDEGGGDDAATDALDAGAPD